MNPKNPQTPAPKPKKHQKALRKRPSSKQHLSERFEREVSAGGVVFRHSGKGIAFAMMKDSYGKWTFPKGHIEAGEEVEEAAARETLEELGLEQIRFLADLGKIAIWFRDRYEKKGTLIHKDIHYFLFEAPHDAELHPDPVEHVLDARWIPLSRVPQHSSYRDMEPIIRAALNAVRRLTGKKFSQDSKKL